MSGRPGARAAAAGALLLLLALLPWWEGGGSAAGLFLAHTLILGAAALLVARMGADGGVWLRAGWIGLAAGGFVAVCLLSFVFVDYRYGSFLSLWNILMAALLALLVSGRGAAWRAAASWIVAAAGAAQAAVVLILPAPANMTSSGTFANANQASAYINIGVLTALGLCLGAARKGTRGRLLLAGAALLVLVDLAALMRIGARGALAALVIAAAIGGAGRIPREQRRARMLLWGGVGLMVIAAAVAVAGRFQRVGDPYRYERLRIWEAGLMAAAASPVIGIGPGMFERRAWQYNFPLENQMFRYSKEPRTTESIWVEAAAETGVLGLLALGLLIGTLLPRLWRLAALPADPEDAGPALAGLACLLQCLVDTPVHAPAVSLTLIALLAPRLRPGRIDSCAVAAWLPADRAARRLGVAALWCVIGVAWLGVVMIPWRAYALYRSAIGPRDPATAADLINRAVRLDEANPLYHSQRAEMIMKPGRALDLNALYAAEKDLIAARRIDPGNPDFLHQRARLHARACFDILSDQASLDRAEHLYRALAASGLKDPRPRVELAALLRAQGKSADAIAPLRAALDLEPRFLGARMALAGTLAELGRWSEAAQALDDLDRVRAELAGYQARNGYEEDLMRLDADMLEEIRRLVSQESNQPA